MFKTSTMIISFEYGIYHLIIEICRPLDIKCAIFFNISFGWGWMRGGVVGVRCGLEAQYCSLCTKPV